MKRKKSNFEVLARGKIYIATIVDVTEGCEGCVALGDKKNLCADFPPCSKKNSKTSLSYIFKEKNENI